MNKFPQRKQIRLKDYDYSQNGFYFITIGTKDRQPLFWKNAGTDMLFQDSSDTSDFVRSNLSEYGKFADRAINAIPLHYTNVKIDKYVIMPDHVHLILIIANDEDGQIISAPTKSIITVIGQLKRWISKEIGFPVWQKSFYEHIIRDQDDYITKAEYILNNPQKLREIE